MMAYGEALDTLLALAPDVAACDVEAEPAWYLDYLERRAAVRCQRGIGDLRTQGLDGLTRARVAEAAGVVRLALLGVGE